MLLFEPLRVFLDEDDEDESEEDDGDCGSFCLRS
jgi:hypothetical protein